MRPASPSPPLAPGACHVWWTRTEAVPPDWPEVLGPEERARAARLAFDDDRRRYVAAHVLARRVLARYLAAAPADLRFAAVCSTCGGPHGKPALVGAGAGEVEFSISHSGGWAVVAATRGAPVGVDVERIDRSVADLAHLDGVLTSVERRVVAGLPAAERAAAVVRYWVRKEAALKASGDGLVVPPAALTVSSPEDPAAVVASGPAWTAGPVLLRDLGTRDGHAACVAFLSDVAPDVVELDATTVVGGCC